MMFSAGDMPLPGYRLDTFLGRGVYGERWKATGPGGTEVALKFIPLSEAQSELQAEAVARLGRLRHANLLTIEAVWLIDAEGNALAQVGGSRELESPPIEMAVIVTPAADQSLAQRLQEYRQAGSQGIPADELLLYLEDVARALDTLARTRLDLAGNIGSAESSTSRKPVISHGGVKPSNIMLLADSAVVADYGLPAALGSRCSATVSAGALAYLAPESMRGESASASDQYALAVCYAELRTGSLPIKEEFTFSEALSQQQEGRLDLSNLPEAEAAIIARATAANADERFATSLEMIRALQEVVSGVETASQSTRPLLPLAAAESPSAGPVFVSHPSGSEAVQPHVVELREDEDSDGSIWPPLLIAACVGFAVYVGLQLYSLRNEIGSNAEQIDRNTDVVLDLKQDDKGPDELYAASPPVDSTEDRRPRSEVSATSDPSEGDKKNELLPETEVVVDDSATQDTDTLEDASEQHSTADARPSDPPKNYDLSPPDSISGDLDRTDPEPKSSDSLVDRGIDAERPSIEQPAAEQTGTSEPTADSTQTSEAPAEQPEKPAVGSLPVEDESASIPHSVARIPTDDAAPVDIPKLDPEEPGDKEERPAAVGEQPAEDQVENPEEPAESDADPENVAEEAAAVADKVEPATLLRRRDIAKEQLAAAGDGLSDFAPSSLVAIFGEADPVDTAQIVCAAQSDDGRRLAKSIRGQKVRVWNVADRSVLYDLEGHRGAVYSLAFSPDGQLLATGGTADHEVRLWRAEDGTFLQRFSGHNGWVTSLAFSPDGSMLATSGTDGNVMLWEIESGRLIRMFDGPEGQTVHALSFSPDGKSIAIGGASQRVVLREVETGLRTRELLGHGAPIRSVAFSSDGKYLASAAEDKTVKIWDLVDKSAKPKTLEHHEDWVRCVVFSPDSRRIASCGYDGKVHLCNVLTGDIVETLELNPPGKQIVRVLFSSSGRFLTTANGNGTVYVLELEEE